MHQLDRERINKPKAYCAPSSPRPMGSNNTFTPTDESKIVSIIHQLPSAMVACLPSASANVRVTGIEPPSRVRSGVLWYTYFKPK